jgi:ubiquitin carboxyl-terminal hydrolase 7
VGLKNQGATCYMNSLLQSLYHVPALQRAVYKMPTEQETSFKRQRSASRHPAIITRQENSNTQESVALALQRVFYHLQHSSKSVGTKQLTRSFGWDAHDAFTQHDVQELDRVLCENLEDKMKGTEVEHEVPRLFRGKLKNFVKCLNVDFSSERMEYFYDLSLNVRGCKNLAESFKKYTEKERLDGDNKYMAEGHGLQDAVKGCSFSAFPPVLHLHLKRFEYDPLRDANVKINDRFEFDESIDLAPYLEQHPGHEEIYLLHSVLVHSGDVHAGHYYAYIRPDCKGKWYKFNDERVNISNREEAVESNFGFEEESDRLMGQSLMIQRNRLAPRRFSNAYMIVYVKQDAVQDVLRPLGNDDIPSHLQQRFKIEEEEEDLRRKEKAEAHLKLTLKVATWKHLQKHDDVDLHDWQDVLMLLVYKTMTLDELKKTIRETAELEAEDLRLWPCCKRKNETIRTQSPLRVPGGTLLKDIRAFQQNAVHAVDVKIFVEQLPQGDLSAERFDDRDALIFFKYWDPSKRRLMHIGSHIFKSTTKVRMMVEKACALFLPKLDVSEIEALEELKPDKIENLLYYVPDEVHSGEREAQLQDKQVELQSGDIIVIQSASVSRTDDCVKVHYDYLCCKVLVSFRARSTPDKEAFEMHLHGGLTYAAVCNAVANRLNELKIAERSPASGDKLQLCKHLHKDGPNSTPAERKADVLLRDLLNGLYGAEKFILYYEELWYSIEDLKKNMLLRYRTINAGLVDQEECLVDRGATAVTGFDSVGIAFAVLAPSCICLLWMQSVALSCVPIVSFMYIFMPIHANTRTHTYVCDVLDLSGRGVATCAEPPLAKLQPARNVSLQCADGQDRTQ